MDTQLGVILPQDSRKHNGVEPLKPGVTPSSTPKTLILLHGLGDNYLAWAARTSILRYAEEYDVAVLMPEVARSFYGDMVYGRKYFTYITEELPAYAEQVFRLSVKPEDLMIAGLSMGGYGALKCGLIYPEKYAGVGVFSSAWDVRDLIFNGSLQSDSFSMEEVNKDRMAIWGAAETLPVAADIEYLLSHRNRQADPKYYVICGREDFLYSSNQVLRQKLDAAGLSYAYSEMSGAHEWSVWDRGIQKLLDYFICGNVPAEQFD